MLNTYNGYTLEQIQNNLPKGMIERHKIEYIDNCKEVIELQKNGYNIERQNSLKNYNFNLISFYLNPKPL